MVDQLLQISGWAFLGILVWGILYLVVTGWRAVRARFDNALKTEERYMTKKESIQLFNQLNTAQEEPDIQGKPDTGAPAKA
jgi:threonine/homoserine/homoserine lactone efflux protein